VPGKLGQWQNEVCLWFEVGSGSPRRLALNTRRHPCTWQEGACVLTGPAWPSSRCVPNCRTSHPKPGGPE